MVRIAETAKNGEPPLQCDSFLRKPEVLGRISPAVSSNTLSDVDCDYSWACPNIL